MTVPLRSYQGGGGAISALAEWLERAGRLQPEYRERGNGALEPLQVPEQAVD